MVGSPAGERFRRVRASVAYRCLITSIHVLILAGGVGLLARLLAAVHAPVAVYGPLTYLAVVVGVLAALVYIVSIIGAMVINVRWGGRAGMDLSGQLEYNRMVWHDVRHPRSWSSRSYDPW